MPEDNTLEGLAARIAILEQHQREDSHQGASTGMQINWSDLFGILKVVTVAADLTARLAGTPKSIPDQMFIDATTSTKNLYFYDSTDKAWLKVTAGGGAIYGGLVNANGTAGSPFPSGWSVAVGAAGVYTITHNLGNASYVVVATSVGAFGYGNIPALTSQGSNSFVITMGTIGVGGSVVPTNNPFTFILLPQ